MQSLFVFLTQSFFHRNVPGRGTINTLNSRLWGKCILAPVYYITIQLALLLRCKPTLQIIAFVLLSTVLKQITTNMFSSHLNSQVFPCGKDTEGVGLLLSHSLYLKVCDLHHLSQSYIEGVQLDFKCKNLYITFSHMANKAIHSSSVHFQGLHL